MNTVQDLAKMIDHSLLHPTMTDADFVDGFKVAIQYQVASVCIKPYAVEIAAEALKDTGVLVCTVVGFPHGSATTEVKVAETTQACKQGATEIDMVVNIGKVLQEDWAYVHTEIKAILDATHDHGGILKVIFENDFLPTDKFKIKLCEICSELEVEFVKTSTGYGMVKDIDDKYSYEGATHHDLTLMREHCSPEVQVKAAGGIRTLDELLAARDLGATRIGATATAAILEAAKNRFVTES